MLANQLKNASALCRHLMQSRRAGKSNDRVRVKEIRSISKSFIYVYTYNCSAREFLKTYSYMLIELRWISVIVLCYEERVSPRGCLALDTPQNKSRSRLLFRTYDKQPNNVEFNSGLNWPQTLVRGCQFPFTYNTKPFVFLPTKITEERTSRLDNINCRQISKILLLYFKEAIRRLARINESGTKLRQGTCKRSQIERK